MDTKLPPVIADFFHVHNTGETANFNQLFTGDAIVSDEAHDYRGAAIKAWIDGAIVKYKLVASVIDLAEVSEQTIVTAQVAGSFPGSPVQIRYKFALKNGKIAALAMGT
jgi:hypothetical protein